ncbi:MAG: transglycosylase domain-containing protein [Alphaproteobacteria bacterium]|jgi:penicillin-binding protein 1A
MLKVFRWLVRWSVICGIWVATAGLIALTWFAYDLPNVEEATRLPRKPSLTLEAADGSFLTAVGDLYGEPVKLAGLPKHVPQAVTSIEDRRFWDHWGVDLLGIARALYVNTVEGQVRQGGSTLTQQIAKNLFLSHERSYRRKIQELLLAFWLEYRFSKTEILETYLNRAYFGAGAYGIDAAARRYFGKSTADVTLWEAALLAGLLKSPSSLAPTNDPEAAAARAVLVLGTMVEAGHIDNGRAQRAMIEAVPKPPARSGHAIGGRYFSDWVVDQAQAYLTTIDRDLLIRTTIDREMQDYADGLIKAQLLLRPSGVKGWPSQAALIAMTPDGQVRAMVGGRDYVESQFNRATQAKRQPGSVFKLFTFLAALEAGFTEDTHMTDAPIRQGEYRPGNYAGRYYGDVTLSTALAKSLNSVTVRLAERIGYDKPRNMAKRLGIKTPLTERPSLVLGTSGTRLIELTGAFATLANQGGLAQPRGIVEIRDREGNVLYPPQGQAANSGPQVLSRPVVEQMNRMLTETVTKGTGKRAALDRHAAGKTGTTQGYRDAWFIGYTASLVAGVWTGHDNNKPVDQMTGGQLPAQLWGAFMREALAGQRPLSLPGVEPLPPVPLPIQLPAQPLQVPVGQR